MKAGVSGSGQFPELAELSQDQRPSWLWSWFNITGNSTPENRKNGSLTNKEIIHAVLENFLELRIKKD